ncbi:hypothetical protein QSH57_009457 [Fusarium oxysporum f. sp. vasinfectum]|nr:hypothetical protein QSH57_009457 [Fusarium oxysporum f. sp. vasinfectum]
MGDALDAPATEVDVGAAVVDVDAAVAVGGSLEQEDRALVHDGDDRCREAVAQAQREKASAELMNARWVGEAERILKYESAGWRLPHMVNKAGGGVAVAKYG